MQDPAPENITGSKTAMHEVTHHVEWGVVAGVVMVLFLLWYFDPLGRLGRPREPDDGQGVSSTSSQMDMATTH
jgi:hypothetical protein